MKILCTTLCLLTLTLAGTFPTKMGNCTLKFVSDDESTASDLRELITGQIDIMSESYGPVIHRDFEVLVAASEKEFNQMTHGYAPEWSIAVAQSRANRISILSPAVSHLGLSRFREVVVHELDHLYLHRIPNFDTAPGWYVEGMAMRDSREMSLLQKVKISQARWSKGLIPLNRLEGMHTLGTWEVNQAYGQAAAAVYAMDYYYGENVHRELLNAMRKLKPGSLSFKEIFASVTGDDLLDFQEKYDRYIKDNYDWMFLLKMSNLVFVALPGILIAGFYLLRRKNRKKLKLWEIEEELDDLYRDDV